MTQLIAKFLDDNPLGIGTSHGLIHTELLDQHIFVDDTAEHPTVCALIDFADAVFGAVEYEFSALPDFIFKGEPGLLREFFLGYGMHSDDLDKDMSRQLLAWGLYHQFASVGRMTKAIPGPVPQTLDELALRLFGVDEAC